MTSTPTTTQTTTTETPQKNGQNLVRVLTTNEWGQLENLEPNAPYFVLRKPTRELTREKSREIVGDVRSFLNEHKVLTEKQINELNERYGEPTKSKVKELRESIQIKFDEIAKDFETRIEKLENDLGLGRKKQEQDVRSASATPQPETPGEMPTGESQQAPKAEETAEASAEEKPAKKGKKSE